MSENALLKKKAGGKSPESVCDKYLSKKMSNHFGYIGAIRKPVAVHPTHSCDMSS